MRTTAALTPASQRKPEASVGQEVAGIGRVSHPSVGTRRDDTLVGFDRHVSPEVAAERPHGPGAEANTCERDARTDRECRPRIGVGLERW